MHFGGILFCLYLFAYTFTSNTYTAHIMYLSILHHVFIYITSCIYLYYIIYLSIFAQAFAPQ